MIMKEKVTSSNNLLIGFVSFLTNRALSVSDVLVWRMASSLLLSRTVVVFFLFFEEPKLWFCISELINCNFCPPGGTAEYFWSIPSAFWPRIELVNRSSPELPELLSYIKKKKKLNDIIGYISNFQAGPQKTIIEASRSSWQCCWAMGNTLALEVS